MASCGFCACLGAGENVHNPLWVLCMTRLCLESSLLDLGEHVYAALMTTSLIGGIEPRIDDELCHFIAHYTSTKSDDV